MCLERTIRKINILVGMFLHVSYQRHWKLIWSESVNVWKKLDKCDHILCRLEGRSQIVEDELVRLGEQLVQSAEGTRAIALELCREFEDKFLQHIATGEVHEYSN